MEGYSSIFSSSSNSSSSTHNNFSFSLNPGFDVDYDNHNHHQDIHDHDGSHQNGPLINGMMMGHHQEHQRSILEVPMAQSQTLLNNNGYVHHNNNNNGHISSSHHDDDQDYADNNKGRFMVTDNDKIMKRGSSEKKIKKHRYAFQTRSQVDILDDGYRWRKYGQKAVKSNKFPRSYYRCTHQGCNVKKQVQRLSKDEGVVVTTYEGMHSHSIEKSTDNFEHILTQMHIFTSF